MKPQDLVFFTVLAILIWKRNARLAVALGLLALLLAIPLFASWTFFTAERLTWYAASFFLLAIIFYLWQFLKRE